MKIYLDLLPEEKKEEMKKKKQFLKVVRNEFLFSIPILAFFLILLIINFSLDMKAKESGASVISDSSQKEYKELEGYEENFNQINAKVSEVFKIQNSHLDWLMVFYKISNKIPDNVYISDLVTVDYQISLAGKAKAREDFLKMQDDIKSDSCFLNVDAPLSSLVSKEDVEFQINFEVKKDCLKSSSN